MKLYSTGLMAFVATVGSLVADTQFKKGFNKECPYIFWGGQLLMFSIFLAMFVYTFFHWDKSAPVKKYRLALSFIVCMCMYAIAYTGSTYSYFLVLAVGVNEIYLTRKRFGLARK